MTKQELAKFDGRNGQPAYVAVNNIIYDVSTSAMWQDGNHVDQHQAGQDLTEDLKQAPHVRKVVERFPNVGRLEEPVEEQPSSGGKKIGIIVVFLMIALIGWLVLR